MRRLIAGTLLAALALTMPMAALASGDHEKPECAEAICDPQEPVLSVEASGYTCWDPRAVMDVFNDGDVPLRFQTRFVWARTGEVKKSAWRRLPVDTGYHFQRWMKPGTVAWVKVRGLGRVIQISAEANMIGRCPGDLYGRGSGFFSRVGF